jgi:hypothetical protein
MTKLLEALEGRSVATQNLASAPAIGLRPTLRHYWLLYLGALLYLCLRTPYELLHGFVYDEEGSVYLRYAWDASLGRALVAPHQGYYALFPNVCGLIAARALPLEQAGHFLFGAEIAVQMLLVYMLVQCESLTGAGEKTLAVALALLTPPTASVTLSTIHAQFFLAVTAGVILISDAERLRIGRLAVLACAGLTGVASCVLLPFFLLQAWKERTAARMAQAGVLLACTVTQLVVVLAQPGGLHGGHSTLQFSSGALLSIGALHHYLGGWSHVEACKAIGSPRLQGWRDLWWAGVEGASALYLAGILLLNWKGGRAARLLAAAAMLSVVVSFKRGSVLDYDLMCGAGGRYFFIFNVLIGLSLLLTAYHAAGKYRLAARVLVACSLFAGILDVKYIATRPHLPVWSQEVSVWRSDPDYRLQLRPDYWPDLKLTREPGGRPLPAGIYDTTNPGWQDR